MIAGLKADFPVEYLCAQLGVSVSGFYSRASGKTTARQARRNELTAMVLTAFAVSNNVAGYRKVTAALRNDGIRVNRKTIAAIMQELGLVSPLAERAFKTAASRKARSKDPVDLLNRQFASLIPGSILVGDITYVATRQGWLYVATVIDLASRAVLGYATGSRMTTTLVIRAMEMARRGGLIVAGSIFHSDHGTQYRSRKFQNYCGRHGIHRSMGAKMQCWDNAAAETFFSKLKNERLSFLTFTTRAAAKAEIADYIEHFNNVRLHQSLDYQTPARQLAEMTLKPAA